MNSQKKENSKTASNSQPRNKSYIDGRRRTLTTMPPMQPIEREKFIKYKASALNLQVNPINLKLLLAILKGIPEFEWF